MLLPETLLSTDGQLGRIKVPVFPLLMKLENLLLSMSEQTSLPVLTNPNRS